MEVEWRILEYVLAMNPAGWAYLVVNFAYGRRSHTLIRIVVSAGSDIFKHVSDSEPIIIFIVQSVWGAYRRQTSL